jgi:hypothetical protein
MADLASNDPEEAITSIQKTLTDTEQRVAMQRSRYESIDLHDRLGEIRRCQQALRKIVGVVSEKRRAVEPVFGELKDRLRQLDRWLSDLETDDLNSRVEALTANKIEIDERIARIFEDFQKLDSMRKNIGEMFTNIRAPSTGSVRWIGAKARIPATAAHFGIARTDRTAAEIGATIGIENIAASSRAASPSGPPPIMTASAPSSLTQWRTASASASRSRFGERRAVAPAISHAPAAAARAMPTIISVVATELFG